MTNTTNAIEITKDVIKKRKEGLEFDFSTHSFLLIFLSGLAFLYFRYLIISIASGTFSLDGDNASFLVITPILLGLLYISGKSVVSDFKDLECGLLHICWLIVKPWAYISGGFLAFLLVLYGVIYFAVWIGVKTFFSGLGIIAGITFILLFGTGDSLKP